MFSKTIVMLSTALVLGAISTSAASANVNATVRSVSRPAPQTNPSNGTIVTDYAKGFVG